MIRVLLVDDHDLVRAGLRSLLEAIAGIEVVGEASNGRAALALAATTRPDVVLMDIAMPELNGLDATARLVAAHERTRVIILSMSDGAEYVLQSLRAGAAGYLLKNVKPHELEQAIRSVAAGHTYLTPAVARHVVAAYVAQPGEAARDPLTPRQREVLQLVAEGCSTKEVASRLGISAKTAEGHRMQLMDALDIHDVPGLVRYALRKGIISIDG